MLERRGDSLESVVVVFRAVCEANLQSIAVAAVEAPAGSGLNDKPCNLLISMGAIKAARLVCIQVKAVWTNGCDAHCDLLVPVMRRGACENHWIRVRPRERHRSCVMISGNDACLAGSDWLRAWAAATTYVADGT